MGMGTSTNSVQNSMLLEFIEVGETGNMVHRTPVSGDTGIMVHRTPVSGDTGIMVRSTLVSGEKRQKRRHLFF